MTDLSWGAFNGCSSVTTIVLSNGIGAIKSSTFAGCTSLESIIIPENVQFIDNSAFRGCTSLTSVDILSSNQPYLYDYVFYGCSSLTSVNFSRSVVMYMGDYMFYGCTSLTSIILPIINISSRYTLLGSKFKNIYYRGTHEHFQNLGLSFLPSTATVYAYSSTEPTETGDYWHFVDGVPTVW